MQKVNILVTGASGFIGQNFIRQNKHIFNIYALIRKNTDLSVFQGLEEEIEFVEEGDLERTFATKKLMALVHLATNYQKQTVPDEYVKLLNDNVTLGVSLLSLMEKYQVSYFLNISTYMQFSADGSRYEAANFYAATKQAFFDLLSSLAEQKKIKLMDLVFYDTYGLGDKRRKIFNLLNEEIKAGKKEFNTTLGEQIIYILHISDAVSAITHSLKRLIDSEEFLQRYFVPGPGDSLRNLIEIVKEVSKSDIKINYGALPYPQELVMKPYVGQQLPDWQAKISFAEGIKELLI